MINKTFKFILRNQFIPSDFGKSNSKVKIYNISEFRTYLKSLHERKMLKVSCDKQTHFVQLPEPNDLTLERRDILSFELYHW